MFRKLLILTVLLCAQFTWTFTLEQGFLIKAKKFFTTGNYKDALKYYQTLKAIKKDRTDILMEYGVCLGKTGKYYDALQVLRSLPKTDVIEQYIGIFEVKLKAQKEKKEVKDKGGDFEEIFQKYLQEGEKNYLKGEYYKAILSLSLAQEFKTENINAVFYSILSRSNYYIGNIDESLGVSSKWLELAEMENNKALIFGALILQAKIHMDKKNPDFKLSLELLEKANKLIENTAEYYTLQGNIDFRKMKLIEAEKKYKKALSIDANFVEAGIGIADLFVYLKKYSEAEAKYLELVDRGVSPAYVLDRLGSLYLFLQKYQEAMNCFRKAYNVIASPEYYAHMCEAIVYNRNDMTGASIIQKGVEMYPDNPDILNAFGMYLELTINLRRAYEQYALALELNPQHLGANYNMGLISFGDSRLNSAYAKANPEIYNAVYDINRAKSCFETILTINPGYLYSERIKKHLKLIESKLGEYNQEAQEKMEKAQDYEEKILKDIEEKRKSGSLYEPYVE